MSNLEQRPSLTKHYLMSVALSLCDLLRSFKQLQVTNWKGWSQLYSEAPRLQAEFGWYMRR